MAYLRKLGGPITRRRYLEHAFMDPKVKPEDDLGAEVEMDLPEEVRHPNYRDK